MECFKSPQNNTLDCFAFVASVNKNFNFLQKIAIGTPPVCVCNHKDFHLEQLLLFYCVPIQLNSTQLNTM